jgi:cytochrome c oxidase subunit 1
MLFASGVVSMFTIGGLSGVTHSLSPADTQQTDTYYIVAHFHYVIFGGALLGFFAGFYFWWPKVFGHKLGETLGKWNFWTMIVGFNVTFGPMHILGLNGMSRRIDTYSPGFGFELWNMVATIGVFIIALGVLFFVVNVVLSAGAARPVGRPQPRVVHPEPDAGPQLRRGHRGVVAGRVLAPQVGDRRERPGRAQGHGRRGLPHG